MPSSVPGMARLEWNMTATGTIRDNTDYQAALKRIKELLEAKDDDARRERHDLVDRVGRYEERELIWARMW